jgi:putative redox protein
VDLPEGAVRARALFAHCFICSKETLAAARIAGALAETGDRRAALRFYRAGGQRRGFRQYGFLVAIAVPQLTIVAVKSATGG